MCWPHPYICVGLFTDPLRRKLSRGMVASLTAAQICNSCNRRGRTSRSRGDALPALNQAPPPTIEPRTAWQRRLGNCNCKENHMLWWREYPYLLCKRRSLWIPTRENSTASDEDRNLRPRREWSYNTLAILCPKMRCARYGAVLWRRNGLCLRRATARRAGTGATSRSKFWRPGSEREKDRDDVLHVAVRGIEVCLDTFKHISEFINLIKTIN